jgi:hypothetical protein
MSVFGSRLGGAVTARERAIAVVATWTDPNDRTPLEDLVAAAIEAAEARGMEQAAVICDRRIELAEARGRDKEREAVVKWLNRNSNIAVRLERTSISRGDHLGARDAE